MQYTFSCLLALRSLACALTLIFLISASATAQTLSSEEQAALEQKDKVIEASIKAIGNILDAQKAKQKIIKDLRRAIDKAQTDVDKKQIGEELKVQNAELSQLRNQVIILATGVSQTDIDPVNDGFDLQKELELLIRPFVWILKSATENARQIEFLKRTLLAAGKQEQTAADAIERIQLIIDKAPEDKRVAKRVQTILQDWKDRQISAMDRATTAEQQLQARLSKRVDAGDTTKQAFTSFFNDRGRNLIYGILGFSAVIVVMRLLRRIILSSIGAPRNRTFPVRMGALIFDIATAATAFGTTIAIFNSYNDWLLTGFMLLLFIAIGWITLKSLPNLLEQVTLLLNLGAVQEGERLVINGVPWRVAKLDLYTSLVNPSLRGGSFTVPVRELKGQHSRSVDDKEKWFPSEEGDWVVLDSGLWAEVVLQSPEAVQLREEGGAISYYTVQSFLDQNPKNVSTNYRVTIEFGIDYSHQAIAADEIPKILREYIECEICKMIEPEKVRGVYVTLFRAGASSLDYEIEVDVGEGMGHLYETIEHGLARFAVQCCTKNNWTIPFPQLTLHRSD